MSDVFDIGPDSPYQQQLFWGSDSWQRWDKPPNIHLITITMAGGGGGGGGSGASASSSLGGGGGGSGSFGSLVLLAEFCPDSLYFLVSAGGTAGAIAAAGGNAITSYCSRQPGSTVDFIMSVPGGTGGVAGSSSAYGAGGAGGGAVSLTASSNRFALLCSNFTSIVGQAGGTGPDSFSLGDLTPFASHILTGGGGGGGWNNSGGAGGSGTTIKTIWPIVAPGVSGGSYSNHRNGDPAGIGNYLSFNRLGIPNICWGGAGGCGASDAIPTMGGYAGPGSGGGGGAGAFNGATAGAPGGPGFAVVTGI